jgi:hypothetical protein
MKMNTETEIVPYKNLQEVFDKAWLGMKSQNWERATSQDGLGCEYLNKDGKKCAIGHCVPDELIIHGDNGGFVVGAIISVFFEEPRWRELFANVDLNQLRDLQNCHDKYYGHEKETFDVEAAMRNFAAERGLTIPEENGSLTTPELESTP